MSPFHSSLILRITCIYMKTIRGINEYAYVLAILIYTLYVISTIASIL